MEIALTLMLRRVMPALAVVLTAAAAMVAHAEESAANQAARVAATVQTFYDQTQDLTAHFQQTYVNKIYNRTERSSGQVTFKKPGMMRWDYAKPNGKIIVANGKQLSVFEPGQEGEPDQLLEQDINNAQLPSAMAFLMGTGRLEDDFAFRDLDPDHKRFPGGSVLELRPLKPTPHFARIVFYVSGQELTQGLVRRIVIIDESGNRNRFDFTQLKFNTKVAPSKFNFTPPKGTRRVKM